MLRYHEIAPRLLAEHRERRAPDGAIALLDELGYGTC